MRCYFLTPLAHFSSHQLRYLRIQKFKIPLHSCKLVVFSRYWCPFFHLLKLLEYSRLFGHLLVTVNLFSLRASMIRVVQYLVFILKNLKLRDIRSRMDIFIVSTVSVLVGVGQILFGSLLDLLMCVVAWLLFVCFDVLQSIAIRWWSFGVILRVVLLLLHLLFTVFGIQPGRHF